MGASKWGHFALCLNSLSLLTMLSLFGFDSLLVRYISEYYHKKEFSKIKKLYYQTFSMAFVFSLLVCLCVVLFSSKFSSLFFNKANMKPWMLTVAVGIPGYTLFQLNNAVIGGMKKMILYGFFQNIIVFGLTIILFLGLKDTIFPIYFGRFMKGGILLMVTYIIVIYLSLLINLIYVFRNLNFLSTTKSVSLSLSDTINFAYPFFTSSFLILILTSTGLYFLGILRSDTDVGIYDIATKVSYAISIVLTSVNAIATPKFSQYYSRKQYSLLSQTSRQSSKLLFWVTLPIFLLIILFPGKLLSLFGEEFRAGAPALILLAIANFICSISGTVGNLLKMTDNQNIFQNILIASTVLNIFLNSILTPKYGSFGAAISASAGIIFWNICSVYYAYKKLGILTIYIPFMRKPKQILLEE